MSDRTLPLRSPGVRWIGFGAGLLLHDEVRSKVHLLNDTGRLVWLACDGETTLAEASAIYSEALGQPAQRVATDIASHLVTMRAAGLVERSELPQFQPTAVAIREPLLGARLRVFDDVVEVRGNDGALLTEVLEPFGSLAESDVNWNGSQVHAVGIQADGGQIRVYGMGHDQRVETVADAVEVVASLVNTSVRSSSTVLALHAGAVRSRDGKVVVMAGASGSGKSTLTAALVRAGWDYLTDEAVGIRGLPPGAVGYPKPLALDADSRRLLGLASHPYAVTPPSELLAGGVASSGEAGSVSMVFILQGPDHSSSAVSQPPIEWLDPAEALASIAPHSINLTAAGDRGLETLAHLCLDVPTARVLQTGLEAMVEHVELAAR